MILLLFSFLFLFSGCITTSKLDTSVIPDTYTWHGYNKSNPALIESIRQIRLFEDSTFTYFSIEGKQRVKTSGTWHFNYNKITLRSEPNPRSEIKSVDDSLSYFKNKDFYFNKDRLYDREIKKGKGIKKNYYQKIERDTKPVCNSTYAQ